MKTATEELLTTKNNCCTCIAGIIKKSYLLFLAYYFQKGDYYCFMVLCKVMNSRIEVHFPHYKLRLLLEEEYYETAKFY